MAEHQSEKGSHLTESQRRNDRVWPYVCEAVEAAVNTAYGTDPRHMLLARAVADKVAFGVPLPWGLGAHFGRTSSSSNDRGEGE